MTTEKRRQQQEKKQRGEWSNEGYVEDDLVFSSPWEANWWRTHYHREGGDRERELMETTNVSKPPTERYPTMRSREEEGGEDRRLSPLFYEDGSGYVPLYRSTLEESKGATSSQTRGPTHPYLGDYRVARARYGPAKVKSFAYWLQTREAAVKRGSRLPRHLMVRNAVMALKELSGCVEVILAIKLNPIARKGTLFRVDVGYDGWYRDLCVAVCAALSEKLGGKEMDLNDVVLTKNGTRLDDLQRICGNGCLKKHSFVDVSLKTMDLNLELMRKTRVDMEPFPLPGRFARYSPKATREFSRFCIAVVGKFWDKAGEIIWPHPRSDKDMMNKGSALYQAALQYAEPGNPEIETAIKESIRESLPRKYLRFEEFCNTHGCHHADFYERLELVCFGLIRYFVETYGEHIAKYDEAEKLKRHREDVLRSQKILLLEMAPKSPVDATVSSSPPTAEANANGLAIQQQAFSVASEMKDDVAGLQYTISGMERKLESIRSKLDEEGFHRGKLLHKTYEDKASDIGHSLAKSHAELVQEFRKNETIVNLLKTNQKPLKIGGSFVNANSSSLKNKKGFNTVGAKAALSSTDAILIASSIPEAKRRGAASIATSMKTNGAFADTEKKRTGRQMPIRSAIAGSTTAVGYDMEEEEENVGRLAFKGMMMAKNQVRSLDDPAGSEGMMNYIKRTSAATVAAEAEATSVGISMPWKDKKKHKSEEDEKKKKGGKKSLVKKALGKFSGKKHTHSVDANATTTTNVQKIGHSMDEPSNDNDSEDDGEDDSEDDEKATENDRFESKAIQIVEQVRTRERAGRCPLLPEYPEMDVDTREAFFVRTLAYLVGHAVRTKHRVLIYYDPSKNVSDSSKAIWRIFHFDPDKSTQLIHTSVNGRNLKEADVSYGLKFFPVSTETGFFLYTDPKDGEIKTILLDAFILYLGKDTSLIRETWRIGIIAPKISPTLARDRRTLREMAPK